MPNKLNFTDTSVEDFSNLLDHLAENYLKDRINIGLHLEGDTAIKEAIADHEMIIHLVNDLQTFIEQ